MAYFVQWAVCCSVSYKNLP